MQLVYLRATAAVLVVISQLAVAKRYPVSSSYGVMDGVDDVQDIAQGEIRKIRSNNEHRLLLVFHRVLSLITNLRTYI